MWLRLRQIALVAPQLAPVEQALVTVLGLTVCFRDPGVGQFGLENALLPVGDQLLEVVAPTQESTAAGRYLKRRGGPGGYMVITQCDAHAPRRARVESLGVRLAHEFSTASFSNMQLHPKDTGATFFEIDEQKGAGAHDLDGPWMPAGPDWQRAKSTERVTGIVAAELQCDHPDEVAARWGGIAEISVNQDCSLTLDNASLRFVPCTDGRPEGLGAIDVSTADKAAILASAQAIGARRGDHQIYLCGMRINLV